MTIQIHPELLVHVKDISTAIAGITAGANALAFQIESLATTNTPNITLLEIAKVREIAHKHAIKTYILLPSIFTTSTASQIIHFLLQLTTIVKPDALIISDITHIPFIKDAGFTGEIHLSASTHCTNISALTNASLLEVSRVFLPEEMHLEELHALNKECPSELQLALTVYGSAFSSVYGNIYWPKQKTIIQDFSKPSNVVYKNIPAHEKKKGLFCSSLDISLEDITTQILQMKNILAWKLNTYNKDASSVYYIVKAYKMLRDNPTNKESIKEVHSLLHFARRREAILLPKILTKNTRKYIHSAPLANADISIGKVISKPNQTTLLLETDIFPGDLIAIGYAHEPWYTVLNNKKVYKEGMQIPLKLKEYRETKTPLLAFLTNPHSILPEKKIQEVQFAIRNVQNKEEIIPRFTYTPPLAQRYGSIGVLSLRSAIPHGKANKAKGLALWISTKSVQEVSKTVVPRVTWWLPPIIWQEDERHIRSLIDILIRNDARIFVCNNILQYSLLPEKAMRIAGPFCGITTLPEIFSAEDYGYKRVIISPEASLSELALLPKQSPLALGCCTQGYFPIGISRRKLHTVGMDRSFTTPQREVFWAKKYGSTYWYYSNKEVQMLEQEEMLSTAGYSFFVHTTEYPPKDLIIMKRTDKKR